MSGAAVVTPTHAPADRRAWVALAIVCLGFLTIVIDSTIANVALPSIEQDLGFTPANLPWVVNAFMLTFGSLLLLGGRLGDLVGRKRVFLAGMAIFTVASLACALAQSPAALVVGRLAQGAGGAIASAVVLALIVSEFQRSEDRAKAYAVYMVTGIAGGSAGLLAGGLLVELLDWRWMFYVNLPIGAATIALGSVLIDRDEGLGLGEGVDWLGALLSTAGLLVGIYAIAATADHGWGSARTLLCGAASLLLLAAFTALEARIANPLLPLRILRVRSLVNSCVVRMLVITGIFAACFFGTLYFRHVLGFGALETGLAFLPMSIGTALLSFGAGERLCGRIGALRSLLIGIAAIVVSLALMAGVGKGTAYFPQIFLALALLGLAGGAVFLPLLAIAMEEVPATDSGLASGIVSLSLEVGAALGLAVVAAFATAHTQALDSDGVAHLDALIGGYRLGFILSAGLAAVGLLFAIAFLRIPPSALPPPAPETDIA